MPTGQRPQPPVGTCRLSHTWTYGGAPGATIWWLRFTSAGSPNAADLTSILTSIHTAYATRLRPVAPTDFSSGTITGVWIHSASFETVAADVQSWSGTGGAAGVKDAAICAVVDWLTGAYYRGGHPRSYLPFVMAADQSDNRNLTQTKVDNLQAAAALWLADVNALTHGDITKTELGTVSFQTGKEWRSPPIFRAYSGVKVRKMFGTQRRRIH